MRWIATYLLLTGWVVTHPVHPAEPASANNTAIPATQPTPANQPTPNTSAPPTVGATDDPQTPNNAKQPGDNQEAVSEKKALDSVLKWYAPDGGFKPGQVGGLFKLKSTDAVTLYMRYVPATSPGRNAVLILPRFGREPEYAAAWLAAQLKHDLHVFILYPRGHRPGRRFDRVNAPTNNQTRNRLDLYKDEATARRLFTFDIKTALKFIDAQASRTTKTGPAPGAAGGASNFAPKQTGATQMVGQGSYRLGLVAGAYFGSLSLRYAPANRFAYYVLLSPHRRLYQKDMRPLYEKIVAPVVIVTGQGAGARYAPLIEGNPHPETEVLSRSFQGRGFRLVLGWPGRPNPVLNKIKKLASGP